MTTLEYVCFKIAGIEMEDMTEFELDISRRLVTDGLMIWNEKLQLAFPDGSFCPPAKGDKHGKVEGGSG